jgi:hypothetical protein
MSAPDSPTAAQSSEMPDSTEAGRSSTAGVVTTDAGSSPPKEMTVRGAIFLGAAIPKGDLVSSCDKHQQITQHKTKSQAKEISDV